MKLNWGTGIAIVYSTFAIGMLGLAIRSASSPVLLVKKNYYDDDINYQSILDKKQNTLALVNDVTITYSSEKSEVEFQFPIKYPHPTGTITFFRPSAMMLDSVFVIKTDSTNKMTINVAGFEQGLWRILIDWKSMNKSFLKEEKINLVYADPSRPVH